jgi:hypothetical protein
MTQRARLAAAAKVATGGNVVILHSEAGDEYEDGGDHENEAEEHKSAADQIARTIGTITLGETAVRTDKATTDSINDAIKDPETGHIIFVGHANNSLLAIEGLYSDYLWYDHPELTHLKRSFGVFGCGQDIGGEQGRYHPRIGSTLIDPYGGILYGAAGDYFNEGQPYHFDQLAQLPHGVLLGTPIPRQTETAAQAS